jgi:hypothetical protein
MTLHLDSISPLSEGQPGTVVVGKIDGDDTPSLSPHVMGESGYNPPLQRSIRNSCPNHGWWDHDLKSCWLNWLERCYTRLASVVGV